MLVIAGGIVLGWIAIAVIRAIADEVAGPSPEELLEMARRLDELKK